MREVREMRPIDMQALRIFLATAQDCNMSKAAERLGITQSAVSQSVRLLEDNLGTVLLKMYVSDPGRTTFETWGTMERVGEPGVICAAGGGTVIWVDFPLQKAVELPGWVREVVG